MTQFIIKHAIKIQVGVFISVVLAVIYWTFTASAFVNQVDINKSDIKEIKPKADKVPVMEVYIQSIDQDVGEIRGDLTEIKKDIKTLLRK